jgi:hypothetical protein
LGEGYRPYPATDVLELYLKALDAHVARCRDLLLASRRRLAEKVGKPVSAFPEWLLVHRGETRDGRTWVLVGQAKYVDGAEFENTYFFQDRPEFATVEDALQLHSTSVDGVGEPGGFDDVPEDEKWKAQWAELSARAGINLMLLLTHVGYRVINPPKKHSAKAAKFHSADFAAIELKHEVVVRKMTRESHGEESIPSGREMSPHWRRGHWRHQHYGPGNGKVRLAFLQPQLIRKDRLVGNPADIETTYVGR